MSKDTKGKGRVPETKIAPPTTIKLTKTQRELFIKHREEIGKLITDLQNYLTQHTLSKDVDNFIEELKIDVQNEDWSFDANAMLFRKVEKPEKK